ncbi:MAG: hypothetical protein ACKOYG_06200, partial [Ilumatobacteraceae bacterium]
MDDSPWMRKGPAMRCPSCAADVEATHRFCHQCAAPLAGAPVAEQSSASPINVVPLPLLGSAELTPVPSLPARPTIADSATASPPQGVPSPVSQPLAAPMLAPPPTFQPVPGGVPQPVLSTAPTPIAPSPAAAQPTAPQPIPLSPLVLSSAADEPPGDTAVVDAMPQFIGFDSKGDPVPPPPFTVGAPIVSTSAVTEQVPVVEQTPADEWLAATAEQPAVTARSGTTEVLPAVDDHRFRLTTLLVMAVLTGVVAVSAGVLD